MVLLIPLFMILNYRGDEKYVCDHSLFGSWEGTGRFIHSKLHSEVGYLKFSLEISDDFTARGNVGDAVFSDARLCRHYRAFEKDGNLLHFTLQGKLNNQAGVEMERMNVQLFIEPSGRIGFTRFRSDGYAGMVHLKKIEKLP